MTMPKFDILYWRKSDMSAGNDDNNQQTTLKKILDFLDRPIVVAFIVPFVLWIVATWSGLAQLPQDISDLEDRIERIEGVLMRAPQHSTVDSADTTEYPFDSEDSFPLSAPPQKLALLSPTEYCIAGISDTYIGNPYQLEADSYNAEPIAYDPNSGTTFTAEELSGQKLLFPYFEDGQEVYFYGQIDQTGCWDGECIVNIYEDKNLVLITEAVYKHGKLLRCKQAFPYTTLSTSYPHDVWAISKRTVDENFNSGETYYYFRSSSFLQTFEFDEVNDEDIISVVDFEKTITTDLEGYYYGHTSDSRYNDKTGDAYMVKYFEDGTIRTLYVGNFEDGFPHDNTGNAWMIGKNSTEQEYSYYKGIVKKGSPTEEGPEHWREELTLDEIETIIAGTSFNVELRWAK